MNFDIKNISSNISKKNYYIITEKDDICFFLYLEQENDYNLRMVAEEITKEFFYNNLYSKENLKNFVKKLNDKIINSNFLNISCVLLLTDYNSFYAIRIGELKFSLIRDNKIIYNLNEESLARKMYEKNELDVEKIYGSDYSKVGINFLGKNVVYNYMEDIISLEENDFIIIQNKYSYNSINISKIDIKNFSLDENGTSIFLILLKKSMDKKYKEEKNKSNILKYFIIFTLLFLVFLFLLNKFIVDRIIVNYDYKINEIMYKDYTEMNFENIQKLYKNIQKDLNKKVYYGSKYNEMLYFNNKLEKIINDYNYMKNIQNRLSNLLIQSKNTYEIEELIINFNKYENYEKEINLKHIELKYNNLLIRINEDKNYINSKIEALKNLKDADNYIIEDNYLEAISKYEESIKIFLKIEDKKYIDNNIQEKMNILKDKILLTNENIENLKELYKENKTKKLKTSLKIIDELIKEYLKNNDKYEIEKLNEEKEIINLQIQEITEKIKNEIKILNYLVDNFEFDKALKKYKYLLNNAYYIESNKYIDILNKEYEILMNKKEEYIKMKENLENINNLEQEKEKIILKVLNFEKMANEYMKQNNIKEAKKIYEQGFELLNKFNINNDIKDRFKKKINFINELKK